MGRRKLYSLIAREHLLLLIGLGFLSGNSRLTSYSTCLKLFLSQVRKF